MPNALLNIRFMPVIFIFLTLSLPAQSIEIRRGENLDVSGEFSESLFMGGQKVRTNAVSTDDIFMAGASITQSGGRAENLFIAGGDIDLRNPKARLGVIAGGNISITTTEFKDLILAGGNIRINGTHIQDDAILAGGQIEIGRDSKIDDSVMISGGEILFAGHSGGDVDITGNRVELTGTFAKNVRVQAQDLILGPNVQIAGNLFHGVREMKVNPTAQVQGRNEAISSPASAQDTRSWLGVLMVFLFAIGTLLAPALVVLIFPRFTHNSSERMRNALWESIGKGTVTFILAPLLLIFLFTTVIGVPIALFAIPFYFAAILAAWTVTVLSVGLQFREWYQRSRKQSDEHQILNRNTLFAWSLLGALALMLLLMVPFFGFLASLILFWAGLGALYMQLRGTKPKVRNEDTLTSSQGYVPTGSRA